jgi:hypothetical protein
MCVYLESIINNKKEQQLRMSKLTEAFSKFNPRRAKDEIEIQKQFKEIAETVFYEGYFLVNDELKIYPVDIEFYLYDERTYDDNRYDWMKDNNMYHKHTAKNKVPYFPKEGSLYPHESGVDVTFENEEEEYRASFLIRAYRTNIDDETIVNPKYLNEEMFGECTFNGTGLNIKWVDEQSEKSGELQWAVRFKFHDKNKEQDTKPWRCIKPIK